MKIERIVNNLPYLPIPNKSEIVITETLSPEELTTSSFAVIFDNYGIWMIHNQKRGYDIAGGHKEKNESSKNTVIREVKEEANIILSFVKPIGYQKLIVEAQKPENYKYPFPISYMQFFWGELKDIKEYVVNEECKKPIYFSYRDSVSDKNNWYCDDKKALEWLHEQWDNDSILKMFIIHAYNAREEYNLKSLNTIKL